MFDGEDYLKPLDVRAVAAFYRRLALYIQSQFSGDSLAAILLLHWLDGRGQTKIYPARYVRDLDEVRTYLRSTARPIFLSQRPTPNGGIGGIAPRIRGQIPSNPPGGPYAMHLEGNIETPLSIQMKAYMGFRVEPRELDALYALHGYTLISDVVVSATRVGRNTNVIFQKWTCKASDEYHWNPTKHIEVPNPDYQSKLQGAVAPDQSKVTIYHSNAIRVEQAGLAAPFHDESSPWDESNLSVVGPATLAGIT
jgi:hypothetical protein